MVIILESELITPLQERSPKAFLDIIILYASAEHPMLGYEINRFFLKKSNLHWSQHNLLQIDYHGKKGLDRMRQEQSGKSLCIN